MYKKSVNRLNFTLIYILTGKRNAPTKFGVIFLIPIEILVKCSLKKKSCPSISARCPFPVVAHNIHVHLVYVYHVVKSITFYTFTCSSR